MDRVIGKKNDEEIEFIVFTVEIIISLILFELFRLKYGSRVER